MADFPMPSLGADMEAATLVRWRVKPGDTVKRGDIVAEVETDKGLIEVEIWQDGTVEALLALPGQRVPVGTPLARVRGADEPPRPSAPTHPLVAPAVSAPAPPPPQATPRVRASPVARQLAAELGIPLAAVVGSGPGGAVQREDVAAFATSRAASPVPSAAPPAAQAMRRAIAEALSRSKREIPHYYLSSDVSLAAAKAWLETENERRPVAERLLPVALLVKATALALREAPELNGRWVSGAFRGSDRIHVGLAIALRGGGLVVAALPDTDRLPLGEVMAGLAGVTERARRGSLRSSELESTITVTSLGERGADAVFPVIFPPQVAMVGFGRVRERPWVAEGRAVVRPVVTASLAADHRVSDGHHGSRFLRELEGLLQHPEAL